jgi:hypothetical protein
MSEGPCRRLFWVRHGNTISGAWETGHDSGEWEHDFALTYRRIG